MCPLRIWLKQSTLRRRLQRIGQRVVGVSTVLRRARKLGHVDKLLKIAGLLWVVAACQSTRSAVDGAASDAVLPSDGQQLDRGLDALVPSSFSVVQAISRSTDEKSALQLVAAPAGDAVVGWVEQGSLGAVIKVAHYDAAAGTWAAPQRLDRSAAEKRDLRLAVDGQGQIFAGWIASDLSGIRLVVARRSRSGGWTSPTSVATSADEKSELRLAASEAAAYATWRQVISGRGRIAVARWDAESGDWRLEQRLDPHRADERLPFLVTDAGGNAHLVWIEGDTVGQRVIAARRTTTDGRWQLGRRLDTSEREKRQLRAVVDGQGRAFAGWQESDASLHLLLGIALEAAGGQALPVELARASEQQRDLRLVAAGDVLYAGWIATGQITSRRRDPLTGIWDGPTRLDRSNAAKSVLRLAAVGSLIAAAWLESASPAGAVRVGWRDSSGQWQLPLRVDSGLEEAFALRLSAATRRLHVAWLAKGSLGQQVATASAP